MTTLQGDRDASNAIVTQVGFFAGALARAYGVVEERDQTIAVLRADKKAQDAELHRERVEKANLQVEVERLAGLVKNLEEAARHGKSKAFEAEREITHLKDKLGKQDEQLATVNRALVESHHERDGLRKKLHDSGEALGFLKGQANAFVSTLRGVLESAGYTCATPEAVLDAVRELAKRAGVPAETIDQKPKRMKP